MLGYRLDAMEVGSMHAVVTGSRLLRFDDGSPVRSASAIARFGAGWLIAQDDATAAALIGGDGSIRPLRLFPPVEGHDVFSEADGTKRLKPDLEAACPVHVRGVPGVLLLGSGSTPARMRGALVVDDDGAPRTAAADLGPVYEAAAMALGLEVDCLNFEGACVVAGRMRWFNRGNGHAGVPDASVDVDLEALLGTFIGRADAADVAVTAPRRYALGQVAGVGLSITDAVTLGDGRVLVSAAAEDTPNAVDDGPVVGAALALLDGGRVAALASIEPEEGAPPPKVEGLAVHSQDAHGLILTAVVDVDDPIAPSAWLDVQVRWR